MARTQSAWPGTDATSRLAIAHRERRPAIDPPTKYTQCDRCRRPLGDGIYLLQRGHMEGAPATWFICHLCDGELTDWMMWNHPPKEIGDTQ